MTNALSTDQLEEWRQNFSRAESSACKLILLAGKSKSGKTALLKQLETSFSLPSVKVGLALSEKLLLLETREYPHQAETLFRELLEATNSKKVLLDNTEFLFDPVLALRPLEVLCAAAQERVLVVSWLGSAENGTLTFGVPGHPAYKSYSLAAYPGLFVFTL